MNEADILETKANNSLIVRCRLNKKAKSEKKKTKKQNNTNIKETKNGRWWIFVFLIAIVNRFWLTS